MQMTGISFIHKMVKYDGPLAVLRAFARIDLEKILNESGITLFKLNWR